MCFLYENYHSRSHASDGIEDYVFQLYKITHHLQINYIQLFRFEIAFLLTFVECDLSR